MIKRTYHVYTIGINRETNRHVVSNSFTLSCTSWRARSATDLAQAAENHSAESPAFEDLEIMVTSLTRLS